MKNKKGFTIVELVIVIAVIAILAAVLIPTFSGVISKANQSSALQTARSTLTNALNMSSNATLAGQKGEDVYQTMIVVDGCAYGYTGNELKAINYPTSTSTIFKKGGNIEANSGKNSFNAIAIAAENLIDSATNKAVDTSTDLTGHTFTIKNVDDEILAWSADNKTGCTDISSISVVYLDGRYYLNYTAGTDAVKYAANDIVYVAADNGAITSGSLGVDFFATTGEGHSVAHTVTAADTAVTASVKTPATATTYDAEILINSDFSNKVVVFTTFG
ncbi:MAG: prepilin-type N-terminal cleavage/methylation domain-containing protein [Clostridia bacterium]|nr:prepilin-type N-terminal cleavage/methylation domain-containing protein [Clostridia bacterium]